MLPVVRLYLYANAFYTCVQVYANQYMMLVGVTPLSRCFIKVRVTLEELLKGETFREVAADYPDEFRDLVSMGPDEVDTLWEFEHPRLLRFLMGVQELYILAGEPALEVTSDDKQTLDEVYAAASHYNKTVREHWTRTLERVAAGAPKDRPPATPYMNHPTNSVVNVIQVDQLVNSQIQVGANSSITISWTAVDRVDLSNFVAEIRSEFERLGLGAAPSRDLQAQAATIEAQLKSTQPQRTIIVQAIKSLRNILEGTTGSLVASGLLEVAQSLLARWK